MRALLLSLSLCLCAGVALAKTKAMKGDERKAFMKDCLSADGAGGATAKGTQQDKMKTCNADAKTKDLKGDDTQPKEPPTAPQAPAR